MTLQQLKYIIEIVNCGSMNLAAQKLFVSQPSLSNAVKELEKERYSVRKREQGSRKRVRDKGEKR